MLITAFKDQKLQFLLSKTDEEFVRTMKCLDRIMMTIFLGWTAGPSSSNQLSTALSSTRRNNDVCIVIPANAASDYFVIDQ